MKYIILILCIFLSVCRSISALKCIQCSERNCTIPIGCKGGVVKDACNCCNVCAKISGEVCGGPWQILGKCGNHLKCVEESTNSKEICRPICKISSVRQCKNYCPHGNVMDGYGCPTCTCNNLTTCKSIENEVLPFYNVKSCRMIFKCLFVCVNGPVYDQNGCSRCSCRHIAVNKCKICSKTLSLGIPALCHKNGCCDQPTKFCNNNKRCCMHDSTCFSKPGWYRS